MTTDRSFVAKVEDITPVLPAGVYDARFAAIEEKTNDQGLYWLWRFVARNGDEDVEVTATTSPRITPRTKAAKFLLGMGVNAAVGENVDFGDLIEMPVKIVVSINDAGYSRIENVLPYPVNSKK